MNYFSLLSLPQHFSLDIAQLEQAYFREQRAFHPDRFIGKPATEKHTALQRSMDINQAYDRLKHPLKRAQHLLALQGMVVGTERDSIKPLPSLLLEVMELRESPPPKEAVEKLIEESIAHIARHDADKCWDAMAHETLRLGYLIKIRGEAT